MIRTVNEVVETSSKNKKKINAKVRPQKKLPTGADVLDFVVGGGWPVGKIINIVGDNSTGKTFLAIECIAAARKRFGKKLKWKYDDAESGFSFDTQHLYGFAILSESEKRSETIEEFSLNLDKELDKLSPDEFLIYVVDSLDGLSSEEERSYLEGKLEAIEKGEKGKGTYGLTKQKYLSQFFRTMAGKIQDKRCLLIIISQVRENISSFVFSSKYKRMGGKALDFYANTILWLSVVEKHEKKGRVVGVTIKVQAKKSKTKRPFRSCFLEIVFDYGVDNIQSNLNFLYDLKTETGKQKRTKKASELVWDGTAYSLPRLIRHIEKNGLEKELTDRTEEKWEEIENAIASHRKPKY